MTKTSHTCRDHMVPISQAAKTIGKPYQYVFSTVQRRIQQENRRKLTGRSTYSKQLTHGKRFNGRTTTWIVCEECCKAIWGTEEENTLGTALRVEPFQAYRSWKIHYSEYRGGLKLVSAHYNFTIWEPDGVEASCDFQENPDQYGRRRRRPHKPPGAQCSCGVYAHSDLEYVIKNYSADVAGAADLWGRYIMGDTGWKAQFGKPTALLCYDYENAELVHAVALEYGIPVTHNKKLLTEVVWGRQSEELNYGDWQGEGTGRSNAETEKEGLRTGTRTAPCRETAAGASTFQELKRLVHEGVISPSNVEELLIKED